MISGGLFEAALLLSLLPCPELVHGKPAPSGGPELVLLGQEDAQEPPGRALVGEDLDHLFLTPGLLYEPFDYVR